MGGKRTGRVVDLGMKQDPLAKAFRHEWEQHHRGRQPLGWHLRQDSQVPWVRFHSLPESKRYAEDEAERRIILSRANLLGDRLLGSQTACWLVEANPRETRKDGVLAWTYSEDVEDSFEWRFYVHPVTWEAGSFDPILAAIADWQILALWMSRKSGAVFAPYDGGFDLFPPTSDDVAALKSERAEWLSSEPSGL